MKSLKTVKNCFSQSELKPKMIIIIDSNTPLLHPNEASPSYFVTIHSVQVIHCVADPHTVERSKGELR